MEVKPKALETNKITTKVDEEMKTKKKDDVNGGSDQEVTIIKGHLKIIEGSRQDKNSIPISENTKKIENIDKNEKVMNMKQKKEESNNNVQKMKKRVWDCESTLYDSFELNSFNRQLDSAIASSARSMSMPHVHHQPPEPTSSSSSSSSSVKKQSSNKISRSLQKLIKSMFRHKHTNNNTTPLKTCNNGVDMDKYYVVFDNTGSLTTIPESRESTELVSSEINSLARKTVSERFPPSRPSGISCS